jgi:hypothetical protein
MRSRLSHRIRRDLSEALVDPAQQVAGDFDLMADPTPTSALDRVATFNGLITAMRLATTAISIL